MQRCESGRGIGDEGTNVKDRQTDSRSLILGQNVEVDVVVQSGGG